MGKWVKSVMGFDDIDVWTQKTKESNWGEGIVFVGLRMCSG